MRRKNQQFNQIKKIVLFCYGYTCQSCFEFNFNLEVHHIDKNPEHNDPQNLIPLCKSCHLLVHKAVQTNRLRHLAINNQEIKKLKKMLKELGQL